MEITRRIETDREAERFWDTERRKDTGRDTDRYRGACRRNSADGITANGRRWNGLTYLLNLSKKRKRRRKRRRRRRRRNRRRTGCRLIKVGMMKGRHIMQLIIKCRGGSSPSSHGFDFGSIDISVVAVINFLFMIVIFVILFAVTHKFFLSLPNVLYFSGSQPLWSVWQSASKGYFLIFKDIIKQTNQFWKYSIHNFQWWSATRDTICKWFSSLKGLRTRPTDVLTIILKFYQHSILTVL